MPPFGEGMFWDLVRDLFRVDASVAGTDVILAVIDTSQVPTLMQEVRPFTLRIENTGDADLTNIRVQATDADFNLTDAGPISPGETGRYQEDVGEFADAGVITILADCAGSTTASVRVTFP